MLTSALQAGPEVLVKTDMIGRQEQPSLAAMPNGDLVAVWVSLEGSGGVHGQIFGPEGNRVGTEFWINISNTTTYGLPQVAPLPGAGFVFVWDADEILGQCFDRNGAPTGGEITISAGTRGYLNQPALTSFKNGEFAVTWSWDGGSDSDQGGIFLQRFAATGLR